MGTGEFENGGLLKWRVNNNSDRIDRLEKRMAELEVRDATSQQILRDIRDDVRDVKEDQKANRRLMVAGFLTACTALLTFALNVFVGTGRI